MILVAENDNRIVKAFASLEEGAYGFHKIFGFIGERAAFQRMVSRKRRGIQFSSPKWDFKFEVKKDKKDGAITINALEGCDLKTLGKEAWKLITPKGNFILSNEAVPVVPEVITAIDYDDHDDKAILLKSIAGAVAALFVVLFALWYFSPEEVVEEEKKEEEQQVVRIKEQKVVRINMVPAKTLTKEEIKKKRAHRAVMANLAFTGLIGDKNLKKAVGGAPTELKKVTAGAGPGGDAGSGGEVLVGLGKGVKKVTVGNTGTVGLGGIGTKGKGGGQGGYGDTVVAAGEGKGISTVPVSKDLTLEGGLDKYVIRATFAKYRSQIQACYQKELNRDPNLLGKIKLDFTIGASGKLVRYNASDIDLGSKATLNCILSRMPNWRFPKPRGGVNVPVAFPFLLKPQKMTL